MKSRKRTLSSRILNLFILIIFFASFSLIAQEKSSKSENSKVNEMTEKLNQKLILSDKQIDQVKSILHDYFTGLQTTSGNGKEAAKLQSTADEKIQILFDKKQKMKFGIISDDWWALAKG